MKSFKLAATAIANLTALFLLQWFPVAIIGTSISTDLLFSALIIPQVIAAIFASNLLQVLIPVIVEEEQALSNGVFGGIAVIVAASFLLLYSIIAYLTPQISAFIYSSYSVENQTIISQLIRISLIGSFFMIMVATYSAAYYTEKKPFLIETFGFASGFLALVFMATTLSTDNIEMAIWSINLRWALCFCLLFFFSNSKKINLSISTVVKKIFLRLKNLVLGSSVHKTDVLVDRYLSAQALPGDLTMLHIVQQVFSAFSALLNRVVLTPNAPSLAKFNTKGQTKDFNSLFKKTLQKVLILNIACFLCLAIACVINLFLPDIMIAGALIRDWLHVATLTSGIILGGTYGGAFTVRYYATGNTSTPTKVALIGFLNGCAMKLIAFQLFGFNGLLIAISAHYLITTGAYYLLYRKELNAKQSY